MKSNLVLLAAFVVVLYFVWPTTEVNQQGEAQPAPSSTTTTKKVSENKVASNNPKPKPIQKVKPVKPKKMEKVTQVNKPVRQFKVRRDHVLFEVKMKNWAVSFGDVLLGKIQANKNINIGQYKPPQTYLWPSAEIPYIIDPSYRHPQRVMEAIQYFNDNTPIQFVPRGNQEDGIVFQQGDEHCYSYLGKIGNFQPIFLSDACQFPQIVHELMHALGFVHEHSRTDRESYVDVNWKNIDPKFHLQFLMVPQGQMLASGQGDFDFKSVMLYDPRAFALTGKASLSSKTQDVIAPTSQGLSPGDLEKLNLAYGN